MNDWNYLESLLSGIGGQEFNALGPASGGGMAPQDFNALSPAAVQPTPAQPPSYGAGPEPSGVNLRPMLGMGTDAMSRGFSAADQYKDMSGYANMQGIQQGLGGMGVTYGAPEQQYMQWQPQGALNNYLRGLLF